MGRMNEWFDESDFMAFAFLLSRFYISVISFGVGG